MTKKIILFLTIFAMLGTMISVPAFADAKIEPTPYSIGNAFNWTGATNSRVQGLYGKPDEETAFVRQYKTTSSPERPSEDSSGIPLTEGDTVKFSLQLAWDDYDDYFQGDYIFDVKPRCNWSSVPTSGVGFVPHDGIFQKAQSGVEINGTQNPVMIPEKNWCTYDFVYTIGSSKDTLDVYADGVCVLEGHQTDSTIKSKFKGFYLTVNTAESPKISFGQGASGDATFPVTVYPRGYEGEIVVESAFDDEALNKEGIKFAGLPDGSLHYIGSDAQPSNDEMQALIKAGFNVTTEFVADPDAENDPGRIGYIRMTYNDGSGSVRYKKVMGGNVVDLVSLDFDETVSSDATKGDYTLINSKVYGRGELESRHMGYSGYTKGTQFQLKYEKAVLGKSASNYALTSDTNETQAGKSHALLFSSRLNDYGQTSSPSGKEKMAASGVISYEFSMRLPEGLNKVTNSQLIIRLCSNASAYKYFNPILFDGATEEISFGRTNYDEEKKVDFSQMIDEKQWNRYAIVVDTLNDKVSMYVNGVKYHETKPKSNADIINTGMLVVDLTSKVTTDLQIDDVVIRSVTPDYTPEVLEPCVVNGDSWINNDYRYVNPTENTLADFVASLELPENSDVVAYKDGYVEADNFGEAKIIMFKNADESIIRYYDVVSSVQTIEYEPLLDVDFSSDSAGTLSDELTFTAGTKRLTATCHSYKDKNQKLNLIVAAYDNDTLVALGSHSQDTTTDRNDRTRIVDVVIPEGETVTKFKVFAINDNSVLDNLTPWRTSVEWTKK